MSVHRSMYSSYLPKVRNLMAEAMKELTEVRNSSLYTYTDEREWVEDTLKTLRSVFGEAAVLIALAEIEGRE